MRPFVRDGDILEVKPLGERPILKGDIVLYACDGYPVVHRVVARRQFGGQDYLTTQGDAFIYSDKEISLSQVYGRVVWVDKNGRRISTESIYWRMLSWLWISLMRVRGGISGLKMLLSKWLRKS